MKTSESWYMGDGGPQKYNAIFDKEIHTPKVWPYKIQMTREISGLVLDVGCGPGVLCKYLPNAVFLDFSSSALGKAWVGDNRPRVLASAEDIPFRKGVFDSVLASEIIEHTDNPKRFIQELGVVLKENCLLALSFPWKGKSPTHKWKRITKRKIKSWIKPSFRNIEFVKPCDKFRDKRGIIYATK